VSAGSITAMKLMLPHIIYTSPNAEESTLVERVTPLTVDIVAKTLDIYSDFCRIDISYSVFPNVALDVQDMVEIVTGEGTFVCTGTTIDKVNGFGSCRFSGDECRALFTFPTSPSASIDTPVYIAVFEVGTDLRVVSSPVSVTLNPIKVTTTAASSTTLMRASVPRSPRSVLYP
jgi:hypothetical protein